VASLTLAGETFVLVPRDAVPVYHDAVLRSCREAGFVPNATKPITCRSSSRSSRGPVALVPSSRESADPGVTFCVLKRPSPVLGTALAWKTHPRH
jgi:hypothetical protein